MDTRQKKRPQGHRTKPAERTRRPAQAAARHPAMKKVRPRRSAAPDVVYTPPKPLTRNRLLLHLATIVAVVIALTFGISIFFKVKTVTVSGNEKYTAWTVREASGIQDGENLLTLGRVKARARIAAALPYVEKVRIGIKLPDTVNIEIVEQDVVYAIKSQSGDWWLMSAEGKVVEQVDSGAAATYTQLLGVELALPATGQQAVAAETLPPQDGSDDVPGDSGASEDPAAAPLPKPVTVTGEERLNTALRILRLLEDNEIMGGAASVDVSDLGSLELWYGRQYRVMLGDSNRLEEKIASMKAAVDQMGDYQSGVLDVSFTIWPDQVGYTPAE